MTTIRILTAKQYPYYECRTEEADSLETAMARADQIAQELVSDKSIEDFQIEIV